jgi:hypothetical protein
LGHRPAVRGVGGWRDRLGAGTGSSYDEAVAAYDRVADRRLPLHTFVAVVELAPLPDAIRAAADPAERGVSAPVRRGGWPRPRITGDQPATGV